MPASLRQWATPDQTDRYRAVAHAIDMLKAEVLPREAEGLDRVLRWHGNLTIAQCRWLHQLGTRYLSATQLAELLGQLRLF